MKKQMGITLIILGIIILGCGIFFTFSGKGDAAQPATTEDANPYQDAKELLVENGLPGSQSSKVGNSELDSKQKGNDFEGYIADILKANELRLKEWNQGTTSPGGAYAENELNPDFRVMDTENNLEYWVECKYRSALPENGFFLDDSQLSRYHQIQGKSKKKVLIVFGVGGIASAPENIYVIPVDTMVRFKRITDKYLPNYSLSNPRADFRKHIRDWFYDEVFKKN